MLLRIAPVCVVCKVCVVCCARHVALQAKAGKATSKKARRKHPAKAAEIVEDELALLDADADARRESDVAEPDAECTGLAMRRADFDCETERRRLFGNMKDAKDAKDAKDSRRNRRRGPEGRTLHHRRLFLVLPGEPWPKPEDSVRMVSQLDADGAVFDFEETEASLRSLGRLKSVLAAEDPELLRRYLQRCPFSLDGLLVLAEHQRQQGAHEQAAELVRRAVYTVECAFALEFCPFQGMGSQARPRVRLRMPSWTPSQTVSTWAGWSWLRALWLHMHCLAGQGMHRTALEVCKLLLAAMLPRDPLHVLLWADHLCLRSRQFQTLLLLSSSLAGDCGMIPCALDLAFPNFAFSVALVGLAELGAPDVTHLTLQEILGESDSPPARLMRALLYFPGCVRPLLEEAVGSFGPSWAALLARQPFVNALDYRHQKHAAAHGRLGAAYAKLCGPLWKPHVNWLHACAARWVKLHESEVFARDIADARARWAKSAFWDPTLEDYQDLLEPSSVPRVLESTLSARLHPPNAGIHGIHGIHGMQAHAQSADIPNMSIFTPPAILFFQSLLPWSSLDQSGATAEPLFWGDIAGTLAGFVKDAGQLVRRAAAGLWKVSSTIR